jgi:hypothetical protein
MEFVFAIYVRGPTVILPSREVRGSRPLVTARCRLSHHWEQLDTGS